MTMHDAIRRMHEVRKLPLNRLLERIDDAIWSEAEYVETCDIEHLCAKVEEWVRVAVADIRDRARQSEYEAKVKKQAAYGPGQF